LESDNSPAAQDLHGACLPRWRSSTRFLLSIEESPAMITLSIRLCCTVLLLSVLAARSAGAEVIFDSGVVGFSASGTQFGRLFRDGTPSDWASAKAFPGVAGAPAARDYEAFVVDSGIYSYIQITFDDSAAAFFASAYGGAFTPVNLGPSFGLDTNYLGDAGSSGLDFGNAKFFQFVVAPHSDVVIVLSEVAPGGGAGQGFQLIVEGFFDVDYNDSTTDTTGGDTTGGDTTGGGTTGGGATGSPVPEPAVTLLIGTSVLAFASRRWKRSSPRNRA
jgi:hypothetical protein